MKTYQLEDLLRRMAVLEGRIDLLEEQVLFKPVKNPEIKIQYDGKYPNLCSGELIVTIKGQTWNFGNCLSSGGYCTYNRATSEIDQGTGEWIINDDRWPKDFPAYLKDALLDEINNTIPHGCCGGCS